LIRNHTSEITDYAETDPEQTSVHEV